VLLLGPVLLLRPPMHLVLLLLLLQHAMRVLRRTGPGLVHQAVVKAPMLQKH
jgi:hypothetical protein